MITARPIVNINDGATLDIGGEWNISTHIDDTVRDIVNINVDAAEHITFTLANTTLGDMNLEGEATVNMNDPNTTLVIPSMLDIGNQTNDQVAIFNMVAGSTVEVGNDVNLGISSLGSTGVDELNMGAGSLLTVADDFLMTGWDGGGTFTHAAGKIDLTGAGSVFTLGNSTIFGFEAKLDMTGGTIEVETSFGMATGLQVGATEIDRLHQSSGLIDVGTSFGINHTGRVVLSGDATLNTGTDLDIGVSADATADSRFTASGNATVNIGDDIDFAVHLTHGANTFTIKDNAVVNVGLVAGDDFNVINKGTVDIEGGTLNIFEDFNIGTLNNSLQRTVNQSGGAVVVGDVLDLASPAPANLINAEYNMTGGTLFVGTELDLTSNGTVAFNFDGGILSAAAIDDPNNLFNYGAGTLAPGFDGTADLTAVLQDLTMTANSMWSMDILTPAIIGVTE